MGEWKRWAILALLASCTPVTGGPRTWSLHCDGDGCPRGAVSDSAHSVSVRDPGWMLESEVIEEAESSCTEFVTTAPRCFLDVFCEGEVPTGCTCYVLGVSED